MKKIKYIKRQDSGFKLTSGNSGETSLNLSNEIFDFISQGNVNKGEEKDITFRVYKEDCIKAMAFIIMKLPLYKSSSNYSNKIVNYTRTFEELYYEIESFFGNEETAKYSVKLFYRPDGRIYLKGLRVNGFSIRDYLVENYSALQFDDGGEENYNLRILSDVEDNGVIEDNDDTQDDIAIFDEPLQQIFYGAPGTGKSYKIKRDVEDAKRIYFRTTFHPDSDYSTFVGCYKPTMNKVRGYNEEGYIENEGMTRDGENHEPETKGEIVYSYTPQAFTNAYIRAWQVEEPVFLIIEEINRGNCAQIFGDLFQLLDRDGDGYSQYKVDADTDLADHIREKLGNAHKEDTPEYIYKGEEIKLQLPNNLYIWATMNTSDQSLFPIDSAFKRRWEWVYSPIAEGEGKWEIEGQGENSWWKFIQGINEVIDITTHSEDKKLGYYFCKPAKKDSRIISKNTFVNKVVFYLWNDVFKVYGFKSDIFDKEVSEKDTKKITFKDFYKDDGEVNDDTIKTFVQKVMSKAPKAKTQIDEENQQGEQNETQTEA